jgi:phage gp29-like protein
LEQHLTAIFYGHALIQLGDIVNDEFKDFELVPREHVVPEFGIVKDSIWTYATDGVNYRQQPYSDYLIEIGNKTDLGLLHKASPLVLWKKGIFGAWSHFAELFGMPVRIGKTDILNPTNKANMQTMLANMGSASWGVLNTDDLIEFVETSNTDSYQVYLEFINLINAEMSKLVLGQTGTTDEKSFVGSAQVHETILNTYITAIKGKIESHFMSEVLPKLFMFGMFPKQDIHFKWNNEEQISKQAHFDITKELLKFYNVPAEWINETFNVPVEDKVATLDENKSVIPAIQNLYKGLNNAE